MLRSHLRGGVFGGTTGSALGSGLYFTPAYLSDSVNLLVVNGRATLTNPDVVNGRFQLQLFGTVGAEYQVEASTNLQDWIPISTNPVPRGGVADFVEADSTFLPHRFYRALFLP